MANGNGQRPKLELKPEPVRLKLLRDQPLVGENTHGKYYLYLVSTDSGQELAWFAPPEIHEVISNLKAGSELLVKKPKGGKVEVSVLGKAETADQKPDTLRDLMLQSVIDADFVLKNCGVQVSDELQKLSTAIFIARTRAY